MYCNKNVGSRTISNLIHNYLKIAECLMQGQDISSQLSQVCIMTS